MANEVGRPSKLDMMLFRKIRELVLDGMNLRQISEALEIPYATMRDWEYENYESFSDKMLSFKHERMLHKAEINIETLMGSEDENINLKASIHVSETLGKKHYSKRNEIGGLDGEQLNLGVVILPQKNGSESTLETTKETGDSTS